MSDFFHSARQPCCCFQQFVCLPIAVSVLLYGYPTISFFFLFNW